MYILGKRDCDVLVGSCLQSPYWFKLKGILFIIKVFRTIVFILIVISTTFRPICPPAFFRSLSNSGTITKLWTTSFIESTGVACSDSVSHNREQVLRVVTVAWWLKCWILWERYESFFYSSTRMNLVLNNTQRLICGWIEKSIQSNWWNFYLWSALLYIFPWKGNLQSRKI